MTEKNVPVLDKDEVRCEAVRRYGLPCPYPAKWLTPETRLSHQGGWKVCGRHKHRFETLIAKATPL